MHKIVQLDRPNRVGTLTWGWALFRYELQPVLNPPWGDVGDKYLFFKWISRGMVSRILENTFTEAGAESILYHQRYKAIIKTDEVFCTGLTPNGYRTLNTKVYEGKIKKLSPMEALAYWAQQPSEDTGTTHVSAE